MSTQHNSSLRESAGATRFVRQDEAPPALALLGNAIF
jgi:hypothetical protein